MIRNKTLWLPVLMWLTILTQGCYHEEQQAVVLDFQVEIDEENQTVPVQVNIANGTTGADHYHWSFEGGDPANSNKRNPGAVTYREPGLYSIRLEAWNTDEHVEKEYLLQVDSAVHIVFDTEVLVNQFAPVQVAITNKTRGASTFRWNFAGGDLESSDLANPPTITYTQPGEYEIFLEVSNGSKSFLLSKSITVLSAMEAGFDIIPFFEDEDMEAPFSAKLNNYTTNGLTYRWLAPDGTLAGETDEQGQVRFESPGTYTITLESDNKKEIQTVSKTVEVKPNTNLYTMTDVRMGCSMAHTTIGCFFSGPLRRVITKTEQASLDAGIDIAFFGVGGSYDYCRFISPDSTANFTFGTLVAAPHTCIVNVMEHQTTWTFSASEFDLMENDEPLRNLPIRENESKTSYFNASLTPRMVCFETSDGRKGAIKIKEFVDNGQQSYIIADIKIQKENMP